MPCIENICIFYRHKYLLTYESKYSNIVTEEYSLSLGLLELDKLCKKYDIKNNAWHKNFIIKLINEKRIQNI